MLYLYINGNQVHDEGAHDAQGRVTREGGAPLTFSTQAKGERAADALFAAHLERFRSGPRSRFGYLAPKRENYVVAAEPPAIPDPEPPEPSEAPAEPSDEPAASTEPA